MDKKKNFNPIDWAAYRQAPPAAKMQEVAQMLIARGTDITQGYDNWLRLGFAIANETGEQGRQLYHDLSRMNPQYNPKECDRQYTACLKSQGSGITANTFFMMAKQAGIDLKALAKQNNEELWNSEKRMHKVHGANLSDTTEKFGTVGFTSTFSDQTGQNVWCKFLKPLTDSIDDNEARDKMILGTLAIISGMMPNIYGNYGGHVVYPPLYFIFYGPAASRKGELRSCMQLIKPLKTEVRRAYEAEKAKYTQEHSRWEAMGGRQSTRGERGPEPQEPKFRSPLIPANSSASAAYQALEANNGTGVMFETEADVLTQSLLSDYGDYSAGLRAAFHHEPITMNRIRDNLHIEIEEPRLAVCLTCTPGQLPKLFPSFENGLGSRFLFYGLNRRVEWLDPFKKNAKPLDEVLDEMGTDALSLYHRMRENGERRIQFTLSDAQQQSFNAYFSDLLKEQFSMLGDGITSFIFRMGLSAFRLAMILSLLRRHSDTPPSVPLFSPFEQVLTCNDTDLQTALAIIDTLADHTALIYSSLAKEDDNPLKAKQNNGTMTETATEIYRQLPDEFTTNDFCDTASRLGIKNRTAKKYLTLLANQLQLAERVKIGQYRKKNPKG